MKKLLAAAVLLPGLAIAGAASQHMITDNQPKGGVIDVSYAQRALIFSSEMHSTTDAGVIVVCQKPNVRNVKEGTCADSKMQNQWIGIESIKIPGYTLAGFEYRWIGGGYAQLVLYFAAK